MYIYTFSLTRWFLYLQAEEALNYLIERREFWAQQQSEQPEFPDEITGIQHKTSLNSMINKADNRMKMPATNNVFKRVK